MSEENADKGTNSPTVLGWVIRIGSVFVMAVLAVYLLVQIVKPHRDIVLEVNPIVKDARQQNGQTLLPVEIVNNGTETIRAMNLELTAGSQTREVTVAMLGQSETIRFVIDVQREDAPVTYRILSYEAP